MSQNILVVSAIDFGTSYSGWAFSFPDEFQRNPTTAYTKHWHGGPQITEKTPTCILVQPDGQTLVAFGYDAENKYVELVKQNHHEAYYFFKQFKMALGKKLSEKLDRTLLLEDVRGKTMPALDVFSMAIKYLLEDLLKTINHAHRADFISLNNMLLVLTVPALWTDRAIHFMMEAAQKAGVDPKLLILALEPEVASVFCQVLPGNCTTDGKFMQFPIGARYIVLDAGGKSYMLI